MKKIFILVFTVFCISFAQGDKDVELRRTYEIEKEIYLNSTQEDLKVIAQRFNSSIPTFKNFAQQIENAAVEAYEEYNNLINILKQENETKQQIRRSKDRFNYTIYNKCDNVTKRSYTVNLPEIIQCINNEHVKIVYINYMRRSFEDTVHNLTRIIDVAAGALYNTTDNISNATIQESIDIFERAKKDADEIALMILGPNFIIAAEVARQKAGVLRSLKRCINAETIEYYKKSSQNYTNCLRDCVHHVRGPL